MIKTSNQCTVTPQTACCEDGLVMLMPFLHMVQTANLKEFAWLYRTTMHKSKSQVMVSTLQIVNQNIWQTCPTKSWKLLWTCYAVVEDKCYNAWNNLYTSYSIQLFMSPSPPHQTKKHILVILITRTLCEVVHTTYLVVWDCPTYRRLLTEISTSC